MKLLILESPGKVKKVQEILGKSWKVVASVGHVRDLPEKELGVSIPDFVPDYVPTKRGKDVLKKIGALVKNASEVYLATDPDREGEAIAWHIADALNLSSPKRVTYGEITASAINSAIATPRIMDMALVKAQEARRILDRFCGYMVSGPLSNAANTRLSAGRVQSPAVRLVVEREQAINAFVPTTHYGAELTFQEGFTAKWLTKDWHEGDYLLDKNLAEKAAAINSLTVENCKESESRLAPPAPFTTSSLQQAASNALGFTPKNTMSVAQKLYEGGHITYMRTDSPNLSVEAVEEIRSYCSTQNWLLVEEPRTWKSKKGAQEAHEAIRPTHIELAEAGDNKDERALYELIRLRTLATQLKDAVYDVRTLNLQGDLDGKKAIFEAKGRILKSSGWKILMQKDAATQDTECTDDADNPVPSLTINLNIVATSGKILKHTTKPPTRYSEASLVRELENKGIGRPATFAAIIDTIMQRGYVRTEKKHLMPTPLGIQLMDFLCNVFSFVDYDFTRLMETSLDGIASGKTTYKDVLTLAHTTLGNELGSFINKHLQNFKQTPKTTEFSCEKCGTALRHIQGKRKDGNGSFDFFACPDEKCKATFPNDAGKPGKAKEKAVYSKYNCTSCGNALVVRKGAKGEFFGCSSYPKCKATFAVTENGSPNFGGTK